MLIALAAMFMQQTFASVGRVLPAVLAPLVIAELHVDPGWVGVYYGVSAAASLVAQMGCGSFIIRYGALGMSQASLLLLGGGMAVAAEGSLPGFAASAIVGGGGAAVSTPTSSQLLGQGFTTPPGAIGVLDQADRDTRGFADLRLSRPGNGGGSGMARRGVGYRNDMRPVRGSAAAVAGSVRR
jgi:hypothetical protein